MIVRDVYVRGKYRDIILPFTVLKRLDVLLEEKKETVLENNQFLIDNSIDDKSALTKFSGYPFYNTSRVTMGKNRPEDTKFKNYYNNKNMPVPILIIKKINYETI